MSPPGEPGESGGAGKRGQEAEAVAEAFWPRKYGAGGRAPANFPMAVTHAITKKISQIARREAAQWLASHVSYISAGTRLSCVGPKLSDLADFGSCRFEIRTMATEVSDSGSRQWARHFEDTPRAEIYVKGMP